jgi:hypothetical protein
MKTKILIAIFIILMLPTPSAAYSDLADDFLLQCRQLDRTFPPDDWSDEDLRTAALEVLDIYEADGSNDWAVYFCLVTLGHTRNPDDVVRILNYEETRPEVVLRSLAGFPDPVAVECMLRWLESDDPFYRELAVRGIGDIDLSELNEADEWHSQLTESLNNAWENEEFEDIAELIEEAIQLLELQITAD